MFTCMYVYLSVLLCNSAKRCMLDLCVVSILEVECELWPTGCRWMSFILFSMERYRKVVGELSIGPFKFRLFISHFTPSTILDPKTLSVNKKQEPNSQNWENSSLSPDEYHTIIRQGHHYNGGQVARQLYMMCSICGHRFANHRFGVHGGRGWAHSVARPYVPSYWHIKSIYNRLAAISKREISIPRFGGLGKPGGRGWVHSMPRPWVHISSSLTSVTAF